MEKDVMQYLILGLVCGVIVGGLLSGGQIIIQCLLPFAAIFIILGMFVFVGLLVDPKGTTDYLQSWKEDWDDIFKSQ